MKRHVTTLLVATALLTTLTAVAQFPSPRLPGSPARHARYAASAARDAVETVEDVNEIKKAVDESRKLIDSLVAADKSDTPGQVHFILLGVDSTNETIGQLNEALGKNSSLSNLTIKRSTKSGAIVFECSSEVLPLYTWQRLPSKLQKGYFIHSKDANNLVLLYKIAPAKPGN